MTQSPAQAQAPQGPLIEEIFDEVFSDWQEAHGISKDVTEQKHTLMKRTNSWISPHSVGAGVRDIMSTVFVLNEENLGLIEDLGTRLGRRLNEEGKLIASPRRTNNLGG